MGDGIELLMVALLLVLVPAAIALFLFSENHIVEGECRHR